MWELVRNGGIDVICSNILPMNGKQKSAGYVESSSGDSGIQETLPALITGWVKDLVKEL